MIRSAANASMSRTRSASAPFSTSSRRAILSSVIVGLRSGHRLRNPNLPKIGGDRPPRRRPRAALRQGLRARPLTPRQGAQTNATAAKRFFRRLLAGLKYEPKRLVTDGLRSYGVARRKVLPEVRHRTSRYLNNRAENSHRPTRRRERQMQRFKSAEQAQRFLSAHAMIYGHFRPWRHLMTAAQYRRARAKAFRVWRQETCVQMAA